MYSNIGDNEDCPYTMDSENCEKLGGNEYGECSIGNIFGEAKDECKNLSKNEWKTGKNESFCFEDLSLSKDSCVKNMRGEWKKVYGTVNIFSGNCDLKIPHFPPIIYNISLLE